MTGYQVRGTRQAVGGHVHRLRVPSDRRQLADPDGHGARIGISPAQWSLFGQAGPGGRPLARALRRSGAEARAKVLIAAPGRGDSARFSQMMSTLGSSVDSKPCPMHDIGPPPHRGRMLHCRRGPAA